MFHLSVLVLYLPIVLADVYIPGTPGASWTEEEIIVVKAKLQSIFRRGGGYDALHQLHPDGTPGPWETPGSGPSWMLIPNAPKILRLGFHDCLKYDDGSGGCDGCLNWSGVGVVHEDAPNQQLYADVKFTNNNGLGYTVEVLEGIYTDPNFPLNLAPTLNISLRDSGKSRADLWAYATILAVEYGVETNNIQCDDSTNIDPSQQCHHQQGLSGCKINLGNKMIKFKTGRSDCTEFESAEESYKATKHESHPNAVGNGQQTVDFFAKDFGLSGPEMVALLGAHTFGRLHVGVSLFRYVWTSRGTHLFNNHYYKNIIAEDEYFFNDNACTKVTDAWGNKPKTQWRAHVRADTSNGGPVHWIHFNYVCPNCVADPNNGCCLNNPNPEENFCRPDPGRETYHPSVEGDNNVNGGCEKYRFISGLDEMALPCEIGLYYEFNVTDDGIPYGCEGFTQGWINNETRIGGHRWATPECPKNMMSFPSGSTPLATMFEEYAADQERWYIDFVDVLEKMLNNGYEEDALVETPDHETNVVCPRQGPWDWRKFYNCFHDIRDGPYFRIVSQLDGRAIFGSEDASTSMQTKNETCQGQLWYTTDFGNQVLNKETRLPLSASYGVTWRLDGDFVALDDESRIIDLRQGRALDRGWNQVDGTTPGTYTPHGGPNQKWTIEEA